MLNHTSDAAAAAALLLHYVLLVGRPRCFFLFLPTLLRSYMAMDAVVQNPQKRSGCHQGTTTRKNM